nr:hypothetical protein CR513_18697 [Ipomoea trifida]
MVGMTLLDGDMGGVNGDDGEPGMSPMAAANSIAFEVGDGTADPEDTYKGLSSSCVVQPRLENSMSVFTHVPSSASPLIAKLGARHTAIMVLSWIPSPGVFTGMEKRAFSPIVRVGTRARPDLKREHPELVR